MPDKSDKTTKAAKVAKTKARAIKTPKTSKVVAAVRRRAPRKIPSAAPVEMSDKSAPITAARMEAYEVSAATEAAREVQAMAVTDVLARHARGEGGDEWRSQLQALINGASPDDMAALRRTLLGREPGSGPGVNPDLELSAGWREGRIRTATCCRARATRSRSTGCRSSC